MRKVVFTLLVAVITIPFSQAQSPNSITVLTLDDCIQTGLDRNTQVMRARNNELIARANRFQAVMNFFPTLSASTNYDFFFGNFFDTNAARQVSATTNSSNPNLSSGVTLFNGLANQNTLKQRVNEFDAATYGIEDSRLTVESTIISNYLQVISDRENIKITRQRVELLENQLDRAKKRESVGVGSMEEVYNFQSQLATEKLNLVTITNQQKRNKLILLQSMQLDLRTGEYEIADFEVNEDLLLSEIEPFDVIMTDALDNGPSVRAAKSNMMAAKYQMKATSAARFPRITARGVIGSNYSSNGARNPETGSIEQDASFFDQMQYNEFQYLNFGLSIPIFDNYRRTTDYQVSKINLSNAEIGVKEAVNNITNLVQQAYLDYVAAQETYISAKDNLQALDQSFEFMKKRYETGNSNFYNYLESLNNKNRAEIQLVNAKYSIVLRKKILDLYRAL